MSSTLVRVRMAFDVSMVAQCAAGLATGYELSHSLSNVAISRATRIFNLIAFILVSNCLIQAFNWHRLLDCIGRSFSHPK